MGLLGAFSGSRSFEYVNISMGGPFAPKGVITDSCGPSFPLSPENLAGASLQEPLKGQAPGRLLCPSGWFVTALPSYDATAYLSGDSSMNPRIGKGWTPTGSGQEGKKTEGLQEA